MNYSELSDRFYDINCDSYRLSSMGSGERMRYIQSAQLLQCDIEASLDRDELSCEDYDELHDMIVDLVQNYNTSYYSDGTSRLEDTKKAATAKTKKLLETQKETNTMENNTMETKKTTLDISSIMKMKMADKMMNGKDGSDLNLAKMAMVQGFTEKGRIDINEVIKAKFTEKIMKKLDNDDEIPMEDLMIYQSIQEKGTIDPNTIVMAKWMGKLISDVDEDSTSDSKSKK